MKLTNDELLFIQKVISKMSNLGMKVEDAKLLYDLNNKLEHLKPSDNSSSKKDCSFCGNYKNKTCSHLFKNIDGDCKAYIERINF